MLNLESSYEQLSPQGSHEDLMIGMNPDLDNKYKSTTKNWAYQRHVEEQEDYL